MASIADHYAQLALPELKDLPKTYAEDTGRRNPHRIPEMQRMFDVIEMIRTERYRQAQLLSEGHIKFNCASPYVGDGDRLAVLIEEVGEVAKAMMDFPRDWPRSGPPRADLIEELVQVAAVACACAEGVLAEQA